MKTENSDENDQLSTTHISRRVIYEPSLCLQNFNFGTSTISEFLPEVCQAICVPVGSTHPPFCECRANHVMNGRIFIG